MKKAYWIIGASDGIGAQLAIELSNQGHQIAVSARNQDALENVLTQLKGDGHQAFSLDVCQVEQIQKVQNQLIEIFGQIDSIIFMAGLYTPMHYPVLDLDEVQKMINVNLMGAFNVVQVALAHLLNHHGQLGICASLSGYIGLPNSQPYGSTKAALINLAQSLRVQYQSHLDIKLINPGFVRTRLTDKNNFSMPMRIEADQAAQIIAKGLSKKEFEIRFPRLFGLMFSLLKWMPQSLYFWLFRSKK